jgi:hypothetical protein
MGNARSASHPVRTVVASIRRARISALDLGNLAFHFGLLHASFVLAHLRRGVEPATRSPDHAPVEGLAVHRISGIGRALVSSVILNGARS